MKLEEILKIKAFQSNRQRLNLNLGYSHGWILEQTVEAFRPYDLTIQQFNILRILRGQYPRPSTILLLRDRMVDRQSDVSRLVDRLLQKGLVSRTPCPDDRRKMDVLITAAGLRLLDECEPAHKSLEQIFARLTDAEVDTLNQLLDKMRG